MKTYEVVPGTSPLDFYVIETDESGTKTVVAQREDEEDAEALAKSLTNRESGKPVVVRGYLHGEKSTGFEIGKNAGLTGEALENWGCGPFYELELEIEVFPNGNYRILTVDGLKVEQP